MDEHLPADFRRIRPPLEGRLVRLRAIEESDLARLHDMFNDPDVLAFIDAVIFPQPQAGTRAWWEGTRTNPDQVAFGIETLAGELVGACDLRSIASPGRSGTMGIWIGKPYWDQGYGSDAVRTLCRFAFEEMNLRRIELHVHETNPRGKRAYEKVGFKEEGRLRAAHFGGGRPVDVFVMGLLAGELAEE